MLDPLFQFILEIAGEFLLNVVGELILEGFSKALESRNKFVVFVALLVLGAILARSVVGARRERLLRLALQSAVVAPVLPEFTAAPVSLMM